MHCFPASLLGFLSQKAVYLGDAVNCFVYNDYLELSTYSAADSFGDGWSPPPPLPSSAGTATVIVSYSYPDGVTTASGSVTADLVGDTIPSLRRKVAAKLGVSFGTLFLNEFTEGQQNDKGTNLQDSGVSAGPISLTAAAYNFGYYQASGASESP